LGQLTLSSKLLAVLSLYIVLVFCQSILTRFRDQQTHSLQHRFVDHLRELLYAAIAGARWKFLSQRHSSELLSVLTMDIQRVGIGTHFLLQMVTVGILSVAYLAVAMQLSWPVTVLALTIGTLLWWILRRTQDGAKQNGIMLTKANHGLFAQAQEFMASMKLVKIHGEEAGNVRQFTRVVEDVRERVMAFNEARSQTQSLYRIGGAVALAGLTYLALIVVKTPPAHLLVMVAIFSRLLPSLSQVHTSTQQLLHMLPAYENWRRLLEECRLNSDLPETLNQVPPTLIKRNIALKKIVYKTPHSHFVLQADAVVIPALKTTAIIGPSGSGKSTLLDILSGLTPPDEGLVLVDDAPLIVDMNWRQHIAYIPQETTILDGSVRDNLTWGNGNIAEEALRVALKQAAADFVDKLPQKLDTRVGERGVRLSGGERQRLALARALLRQPQLLILDEATSALDQDNQRIVLEAIRALHGRITVLIVTHRHEELTGLIDGHISIKSGIIGDWQPELSNNASMKKNQQDSINIGEPDNAYASTT